MQCLMVRCPGTCSSTVTGKLAGLWVVAHVTQVYHRDHLEQSACAG